MSDQKKQNQYTAEFRESAVKLAIESDQPVSKIDLARLQRTRR